MMQFIKRKSPFNRGIISYRVAPGRQGGLKRVVTGLVCVFSAAASFAACSNPMPVSREMSESQVIILGTVMSSHQVPQAWDALDGTDYVVHIDQKVKGKQSGEITIFSEHTDDGVNLQAGNSTCSFSTTITSTG